MNNASKDLCDKDDKSNKSKEKTNIVAPSKKGNCATIINDDAEVSVTPARGKEILTLCKRANKKFKNNKKGKGTATNNNPIAIDDAQETDIVPCGNEQDDSEMIVATPENNATHTC